MEVTAIAKQIGDDGEETFDAMAMSAVLFHPGSVTFAFIEEMVTVVIRASRHRKITRLNLIDHGQPSALHSTRARQGDDVQYRAISWDAGSASGETRSPRYRPYPELLGGPKRRTSEGLCPRAGRTGLCRNREACPWIGYQFGEYVVAFPDGRFKKDVPRPHNPAATDELDF